MVSACLNAPIVLALITSGILSWASFQFQRQAAINDQKKVRLQFLQDKKYDVSIKLHRELYAYMISEVNKNSDRLWLSDKTSDYINSLGETKHEVFSQQKKNLKDVIEAQSKIAVTESEVRTLFGAPVEAALRRLIARIDELNTAKNYSSFDAISREVDTSMETLDDAIHQEITLNVYQ